MLTAPNIADAIARIEVIRSLPSYVAFCSVITTHVAENRRLIAYRMVVAVGAPEALAHRIVERWPTAERRKMRHEFTHLWLTRDLTLTEEAALRLSFFVGSWATLDWTALIGRAVMAAYHQSLTDGEDGPARSASSPPAPLPTEGSTPPSEPSP